MKKVFGSMIIVIGILAAPSAMAIHTCGQMLGSCLAHWDPIVIPKQQKQIQVEPVRKPIEAVRPVDRVSSKQCFRKSGRGYLIKIPCGSGQCFKETNGYLLKISCTR